MLQIHFYRASACNADTARYCYSTSVCLSVSPSNAGIVSKPMDISSKFFEDLVWA